MPGPPGPAIYHLHISRRKHKRPAIPRFPAISNPAIQVEKFATVIEISAEEGGASFSLI